MLPPDKARSTHGELHHVQAGSSRPASRADTSIAIARPPPPLAAGHSRPPPARDPRLPHPRPPPAPSPAKNDPLRPEATQKKKSIPREGIVQGSGERMLRRKPIAERKCASLRLASSLRNHVPVTVE